MVDGAPEFYAAQKTSETCIVVLNEKAATISCEIQYRLKPSSSSPGIEPYYADVTIPAFISSRETATESELLTTFAPSIEFNGRVFEPTTMERPSRIQDRKELAPYQAPEGVDVVLFRIVVAIRQHKRDVRLLVRYTQPTIGGQFLYIPLFEEAEAKRPKGRYRLEALAVDSTLLVAPCGYDCDIVFPSRVGLNLEHQRLIAIGIKNPSAMTASAQAAR